MTIYSEEYYSPDTLEDFLRYCDGCTDEEIQAILEECYRAD